MSEPLAHVLVVHAWILANAWLAASLTRWHLHLWNPAVSRALFWTVTGAALLAALASSAAMTLLGIAAINARLGVAALVGVLAGAMRGPARAAR